jgi:hypothetical protein
MTTHKKTPFGTWTNKLSVNKLQVSALAVLVQSGCKDQIATLIVYKVQNPAPKKS